MNRIFLFVIAILYAFAVVIYLVPTWQTVHYQTIIGIAEKVALIMMLVNGTFYPSRLSKIAFIGVALIIVGALFKTLHLNGADEMIVVGNVEVLVCYLIHFIRKHPKKRLDVLKLLVVVSFSVQAVVVIMHLVSWEGRDIMQVTTSVIFALTFIDFVYTTRKQGHLLDH
jgi:hypothetical protein